MIPFLILIAIGFSFEVKAQPVDPTDLGHARLTVHPRSATSKQTNDFRVPLPAYAQPSYTPIAVPFHIDSSRQGSAPRVPKEFGSAEYLLPDKLEKLMITPELANLNLPTDTVLIAKDTGEKIILPAGTYRQILQLPIDSPLMDQNTRMREQRTYPIQFDEPKSRHAAPPSDPIWVRYESLEKIRIGDNERRGGIDLPSHGPKELGPRIWYAKAETADWVSSAFYFFFGGLGYGAANLAGWSTGNTREVSNDFEYRLVRR